MVWRNSRLPTQMGMSSVSANCWKIQRICPSQPLELAAQFLHCAALLRREHLKRTEIVSIRMNYEVIARKYRPQRFSEVVGQEHVTQTLTRAIELKRIAHAF